MKISNYSYFCSQLILQKIADMSNNDVIKNISESYSSMLALNDKIDIKWALISTSLLMSEGLFKNNKSYDYISEKTTKEIEEKLLSFDRYFPGQEINVPYLLDRYNKSALPFSDFFDCFSDDNYVYNEKNENLELSYQEDIYLQNLYKSGKKRHDLLLIDGPYGCNESIISNNLIDIKRLIIKVRNSLAHSNYEVIDENNVRLYHYNSKKKKLDLNIILDTCTIINILDELNEIAYRKYNELKLLYERNDYSEYKIYNKLDISDTDLIDFIMSFNICDRNMAMKMLEHAKETELFNSLLPEEISNRNHNKLQAICSVMYNYIKPYCDFGIIINNIMFSNDDGYIISDELYNKYDIYDYLKSDFYETSYKKSKDDVYKLNQFNLFVLSFLNCSLLMTHNELENKNIGFLTFDFSSMMLDESIINLFMLKHLNNNKNLIIKLNNYIELIDKEIDKKDHFIKIKKEILFNKYIDNNYFNNILPEEIKKIELEIINLGAKKKEFLERIEIIQRDPLKYEYDRDLSNFIFNALRNSLAHGYVKIFNNKNISDMEILFEDYNPNNKTQLTFRGRIKFVDLLCILTNKENVVNLYELGDIIMDNSQDEINMKRFGK